MTKKNKRVIRCADITAHDGGYLVSMSSHSADYREGEGTSRVFVHLVEATDAIYEFLAGGDA